MTESCISILGRGPMLRIPASFIQAWCVALVALLTGLAPACADEQQSEYLRIYENIQEADKLDAGGKTAAAFQKYQQAHSDLVKFRKSYPTWNKDMVAFRLNYASRKAIACNEKLMAEATAAPATSGDTNAARTTGPEGQVKSAPTIDQPLITLLEPGAEPRSALRFHPKAGDKQTVVLTVQTRMEGQGAQGQPGAMNIPAMHITLETTVKDVSAEGDISYQNVIADASAGEEAPGSQPGIGAAMNAAFAGLKGLTTAGMLSSRGFSKRREAGQATSGGTQPPAAARLLQGQMDMSLTMLTAPLPEEPVGAGAKWEVKMTDKSMGIVKAVYEIVSVEDQRVVAKTTVAIAANPAEANKPSPFGNMKIQGSGEVTIDLARIMPTAGTLVQTMDFGGAGKGGAPGQTVAGKVVTDLRIETK